MARSEGSSPARDGVQAQPLSVPREEPREFPRNFIRTAVCELRFPTILELEEKPPVAIQGKLRKAYPGYERLTDVPVGVPANSMHVQVQHQLRSLNGKWVVTIRPYAIALETTSYGRFADFEKRVHEVVAAAAPSLDADFFTRVGLRYINLLPVEPGTIGEWLRPELAGALPTGALGDVEHAFQEVRGRTRSGKYSLRHGLAQEDRGRRPYALDLDFSRENVRAEDLTGALQELRVESFSFFWWCIGKRAVAFLEGKDGL